MLAQAVPRGARLRLAVTCTDRSGGARFPPDVFAAAHVQRWHNGVGGLWWPRQAPAARHRAAPRPGRPHGVARQQVAAVRIPTQRRQRLERFLRPAKQPE